MVFRPAGDTGKAITRPAGGMTRRPDQYHRPPVAGTAPAALPGEVVARVVILDGNGAIRGLFEYNGAPGPGNPPIAWATAPGITKDPFGNSLPASGGFATVGGLGLGQLKGGALQFAQTASPPAGSDGGSIFAPGGINGSVEMFSGIDAATDTGAALTVLSKGLSTNGAAQAVVTAGSYISGQTSALLEVQGTAAVDSIIAIVGGAAETQHAFSGTNSWAQTSGQVTWGYRMMADGTVEIVGALNVPAGFAAGQQMTTATPAAYQPAHTYRLTAWDTTTQLPVTLAYSPAGELVFRGPVANTAAGNGLLIVPARINLTA